MSNSDLVKKFTVNDDGTLTPSSVSSLQDLENNAVYIIVDEGKSRKIYIWKGEEAPVRRKFISAKVAQQMRQEKYGMVYRIDSLDPGIEGKDFLTLFGVTVEQEAAIEASATSSEEIVSRPTPAPAQTSKPIPQPAPAQTSRPTPVKAPSVVQTPTPVSTPKPVPTTTTPPTARSVPKRKVVKETEVVVTRKVDSTPSTPLNVVTDKLKELDIPQNLEREIIIIGNTVFSAIKEHLQLFSKDVVKLEPMDDLPSGIFPASQYQVRLYIEKGKVLFVEMLREKTRSERDEFIDDMRQSLQDLSKMGL